MADNLLRLADGTEVALRRSFRARRMILRVGRIDGQVVLTLPVGASRRQARRFIDSHADWLARHRAAAPGVSVVAAGVRFPVAGRELVITPVADMRAANVKGGHLLIPQGRPAGPVVAAMLREQARTALNLACVRHVAGLGAGARPMAGIVLRDTRSRWGSCSTAGRLMFSWRLAMAPPEVLDYVAAHEVAHLRYMDHSPRFWDEVARLFPDHASARDWLRHNGAALLAWRFDEG